MIREHRGWLMLCDVQIAYKRMLAEYDALIAEAELRDGPSLMGLRFDEREQEIRRRHGETGRRRGTVTAEEVLRMAGVAR